MRGFFKAVNDASSKGLYNCTMHPQSEYEFTIYCNSFIFGFVVSGASEYQTGCTQFISWEPRNLKTTRTVNRFKAPFKQYIYSMIARAGTEKNLASIIEELKR